MPRLFPFFCIAVLLTAVSCSAGTELDGDLGNPNCRAEEAELEDFRGLAISHSVNVRVRLKDGDEKDLSASERYRDTGAGLEFETLIFLPSTVPAGIYRAEIYSLNNTLLDSYRVHVTEDISPVLSIYCE